MRSPVLAQGLNTALGQHEFSFICPETREALPRYQPIGAAELTSALTMLEHCTVFYADRLSASTLQALRTAEAAGAVIFFDPSASYAAFPFEEALRLRTVQIGSECCRASVGQDVWIEEGAVSLK